MESSEACTRCKSAKRYQSLFISRWVILLTPRVGYQNVISDDKRITCKPISNGVDPRINILYHAAKLSGSTIYTGDGTDRQTRVRHNHLTVYSEWCNYPSIYKREIVFPDFGPSVQSAYTTTIVKTSRNSLCFNSRNLGMSRAPLKSWAHQVTRLFTSAAMNQRGCPKGSPW